MSSVTPLEKDSWKLELGLLGTSPHVPFPSADFVVISYSPEYDHMYSL